MAQITPDTLQEAKNYARDILIGYLCQPPYETEEALRDAVNALAKELDTSYESALRYLMTGAKL